VRRIVNRRIVLIALLGGLVGCHNGQSAGPPAGATPQGASRSAASSAALTADALDLVTRTGHWAATQHILDSADDQLTRRCMQAKGLQYPAATPATPVAVDDEAAVVDLATRRQQGYGIANSPMPKAMPAVDAYVAGLSASAQQHYRLDLFGPQNATRQINLPGGLTISVHTQGCEASSRSTLAGDVESWALLTYLPEQLGNELANTIATAPEYTTALVAWSACMAGYGYRYQTPETAQDDLRARHQRDPADRTLGALEIAVAVADGECALQVHLPAAALAAKRRLALSLPEDDRRRLLDLAIRRVAATTRAQAVLADPG
jgi:hypothetical protein